MLARMSSVTWWTLTELSSHAFTTHCTVCFCNGEDGKSVVRRRYETWIPTSTILPRLPAVSFKIKFYPYLSALGGREEDETHEMVLAEERVGWVGLI